MPEYEVDEYLKESVLAALDEDGNEMWHVGINDEVGPMMKTVIDDVEYEPTPLFVILKFSHDGWEFTKNFTEYMETEEE